MLHLNYHRCRGLKDQIKCLAHSSSPELPKHLLNVSVTHVFFPLILSSDLLQLVTFLPEASLSIFPTSNFLLVNACSRRLEVDFGLRDLDSGRLSAHAISIAGCREWCYISSLARSGSGTYGVRSYLLT